MNELETDIRSYCACGHHSRSVEIWKSEGVCFECRQKKHILKFDSSDGEYTEMQFCIDCLKDFHEGKVSESSWEIDVSEL